MKHLIYGLVDPTTFLVRYIGLSSSGLHRPTYGHRYKSPEWASYIVAVLEEVADPKAPSARCPWWTGRNATALADADAERWWIAYGHASGWPLRNKTAGAEGLFRRAFSPEHRARLSASCKGKPKSAAHRASLSALKKGKPLPAAMGLAAAVATRGKPRSAEVRARISAAQKGKPKGKVR